ncbi:MAG: transporter substrate-binding domain-containing protein [Thermodesulfobacteriota bacterium]
MKIKSAISTITAVLVIIFALAGVGHAEKLQQQLASESTIAEVLKRGTLQVGMSTFKPWAMHDKTGMLIGFEIDVATRLAEDTGVKVKFVPTKWDGIIPALLTGKFDVIIGGMSITPKRNQQVNFSIPYDYSGVAIVADKKLAAGFSRLEDFNRPEVTIAARMGSTPVIAAKKFMPKATLRLFDDESKVFQELLTGRVHAVVSSAPAPAQLAIQNSGKLFLPVEGTFTKEPIGFAIRKGDVDTLNYFNNWIRFVEAEGWLKERKHYWFETMEWETLLK